MFESPKFQQLLDQLRCRTAELEAPGAWPGEQFAALADANVLGWSIPQQFGGSEFDAIDITAGYERLASACLVTTFVLTQRNGACQRIVGTDNDWIKQELLGPLCGSEVFATVGISHLTTSRQHLSQPAVRVTDLGGAYRFDGMAPWVTGAPFADYVVTGGTLDDGREVLAVVPTSHSGVEVQQPPQLLALNASQTASIRLNRVEVESQWLLAGPVNGVMARGTGGGTGSLTTSALAVGATAASLDRLAVEAERRPELLESLKPLQNESETLSNDMQLLLSGAHCSHTTESIRQRANSLVLRAAQAHLAASKGAGFVHGHPSERSVREAMFFLVWSCPQPVLSAALREFACLVD